MTRDPDSASEREKRLNEVLAAYVEAVEAGQQPKQEEWLARYPDLAGELADFFANQKRMAELAGPLRPANVPPTQEDPTLLPEPNRTNGPPRAPRYAISVTTNFSNRLPAAWASSTRLGKSA